MRQWMRRPAAVAATIFALVTVPGALVLHSPGEANADVCASAGRRVSISGCVNVAGAINSYAPPPYEYAPLPQDYPPPPPPPPLPNVSGCITADGRYGRVSVSGCT